MYRQILNLAILLLLTVGSSFWLLYYSELFPVVGGLLGLTGAFAWLGFLSNLLQAPLKAELQALFARICLDNFTVTGVYVLAAMAMTGLWLTHGAILVDTLGEDSPRVVTLSALADDGTARQLDRIAIQPGTARKILVYTGLGARQFVLKPEGLPQATVRVGGAERQQLLAPNSFFETPVILVRPRVEVGATARNGGYDLAVNVNGKPVDTVVDYDGGTVWVGTRDAAVPRRRIEEWRLELLEKETPMNAVSRWMAPLSLEKLPGLEKNDQVEARVIRKNDGGTFACGNGIAASTRPESFPNEIIIEIGSCDNR